jgi:hypothetical protein
MITFHLTYSQSKYIVAREFTEEDATMITVIWDILLSESQRNEGIVIIHRIWEDITRRELADNSVTVDANSDPVRLLTPLLAGPRNRHVFRSDGLYE